MYLDWGSFLPYRKYTARVYCMRSLSLTLYIPGISFSLSPSLPLSPSSSPSPRWQAGCCGSVWHPQAHSCTLRQPPCCHGYTLLPHPLTPVSESYWSSLLIRSVVKLCNCSVHCFLGGASGCGFMAASAVGPVCCHLVSLLHRACLPTSVLPCCGSTPP